MRIRKKHYLRIVLARMTNGHYLQNSVENDLVLPKHLVIIEELKRWLQEILTITDQEVLEREARDILRFLIVEGWLIDNNSYIDQEQTYIQQLNEHFIQAVQQQFSLTADTLALLHAETTTIHYQLLSFSFSSRYEYQYMDVTYFLETYPEYAAFAVTIWKKAATGRSYGTIKSFFFRYLILLISTIPLKEILVPLYVCVDFSFGDSYNQMIQKNIEKSSI